MLKIVGLLFATLASAVSRARSATALANLTFFGSVPAEVPVFSTLNDNDLHITGFRLSAQEDRVYEVKNISEAVRAGVNSIRPKQLNAAGGHFSRSSFGGTNATAIDTVDTKTGNSTAVSASDSDRFYHHVQRLDVDNDGLLDIVTAGTKKDIVGEGISEERVLYASLYWLKQPASNPLGGHWVQTKVIDGPDVFFSIEDVDGDGNLDLLASQFFSQKLVLYTNLTWSDPSAGFHANVIDDTIGPVVHSVAADLNGDGRKEVVVTSRGAAYFAAQSGDENGTDYLPDDRSAGIFAYELQSFTKHVLASGYPSSLFIAAPEVPVIVKPTADSKLPVVIMGGGEAYILGPKDNAFNYDLYTIFEDANMGGVGQICAGDVDGDGKTEVFVPNRKHNTALVFRFQ